MKEYTFIRAKLLMDKIEECKILLDAMNKESGTVIEIKITDNPFSSARSIRLRDEFELFEIIKSYMEEKLTSLTKAFEELR